MRGTGCQDEHTRKNVVNRFSTEKYNGKRRMDESELKISKPLKI
jgi:hypothetical protein